MKKFLFAAVSCMALQLSACECDCDSTPFPFVSVYDATEEQIDQINEGLLALELPMGAVIAYDESFAGDVLDYLQETEEGELEVIKTFYLREADGELQFSTDLENWESCVDKECPG
ncbi:MAG: hypothetical protein RLZZ453_222 [Chlamydiota bacterium]